MKQESLSVVTDASPIIRATAGTLVSTIALCGQLVKWPELLPTLCQLIDSTEQLACEVRAPESVCVCVYACTLECRCVGIRDVTCMTFDLAYSATIH